VKHAITEEPDPQARKERREKMVLVILRECRGHHESNASPHAAYRRSWLCEEKAAKWLVKRKGGEERRLGRSRTGGKERRATSRDPSRRVAMAQTCFAYRRFFAGKASSKANRQASIPSHRSCREPLAVKGAPLCRRRRRGCRERTPCIRLLPQHASSRRNLCPE